MKYLRSFLIILNLGIIFYALLLFLGFDLKALVYIVLGSLSAYLLAFVIYETKRRLVRVIALSLVILIIVLMIYLDHKELSLLLNIAKLYDYNDFVSILSDALKDLRPTLYLLGFASNFLMYGLYKAARRLYVFIMLVIIIILAFLYPSGFFLYLLSLAFLIYITFWPEGFDMKLEIALAVIILLSFIVFSNIQGYDVLKVFDEHVLLRFETNAPCPRGLRHFLGLCDCEDKGIIRPDGKINNPLEFLKEDTPFYSTLLKPGLGKGAITSNSIKEGEREVELSISSDQRFTYLKAYFYKDYDSDKHMFTSQKNLESFHTKLYGLKDQEGAKTYKLTLLNEDLSRVVLYPYGLNDIDPIDLLLSSDYYFENEVHFDPSSYLNYDALSLRDIDTIKNDYTLIDGTLRAKLRVFLKENGIDPQDEDKEAQKRAIIDLLRNNYRYSKVISIVEEDDPILNFLLYSHQGYCVHFAASATLLLRSCDIPARYVEGYLVKEWRNEKATVYSDNAHAWIEIFEEGRGWVPYEVTASEYSDPHDDLRQEVTTPSPSIEEIEDQNPETNTPVQENKPSQKPDEVIKPIKDKGMPHVFILVILATLIPLIALLALNIYRYKSPYRHKVYLIYRILDKYGYVSEDVVRVMEKRRFSKHLITKSDYEVLLKRLKELDEDKLKGLPLYQKLYLYLRFGYFPKA